jgi:hypothetical protein
MQTPAMPQSILRTDPIIEADIRDEINGVRQGK